MSPDRGWAARVEQWSDRPLTVLALLLIPLLFAPFLLDLSAQAAAAIRDADYLIWSLFAVSLAIGLVATSDRIEFLRRHWLDVFLVLVPPVAALRVIPSVFLIWAVGATGRALAGGRRLVARRGTIFLLAGVTLVMVVAAGLIVAVERDDPHATIRTYGDGLWWALVTAATVGYGDKYPVTVAGRAIAIALMVLGISAFSVVTAHLAAIFVEGQEDDARSHMELLDERLSRIEVLLARRRTPETRRRRGRQPRQNRMPLARARNAGGQSGGSRRGSEGRDAFRAAGQEDSEGSPPRPERNPGQAARRAERSRPVEPGLEERDPVGRRGARGSGVRAGRGEAEANSRSAS